MKKITGSHYRSKVDQNMHRKEGRIQPKEGWIRTLRKALKMSASQLANRLGVSTSQVTQMERMEMEDRITIKQLKRVANTLDCDLDYSIVPRKKIKVMIKNQAKLKANKLVRRVDEQMRLEDQQLSEKRLNEQLELEIEKLTQNPPRDLWDE